MTSQKKVKHTVVTQVDDWGRKKFHLEEGDQQEVAETETKVVDVGNTKSLLIGRQEELNIEKYVGRIEKNKKDKKKEVFYCQVCKQGFKCDLAYITHLNSQQHNGKLGMSMKVRAVSTGEVSAKLAALKRTNGLKRQAARNGAKTEQRQINDRNQAHDGEVKVEEDAVKKEQEQEREQQANEQQDFQTLMKSYGLPSSFGSKKVKR